MTSSFLIEIIDLDELPKTFAFVPNPVNGIPEEIIQNLIAEKPPERTYFLPEQAYREATLGDIVFILRDHDRALNLTATNSTANDELAFSKPICDSLSQKPFRLLCRSTVYVQNRHPSTEFDGVNGHVIATPLTLTSDGQKMMFPKPFKVKFENIVSDENCSYRRSGKNA